MKWLIQTVEPVPVRVIHTQVMFMQLHKHIWWEKVQEYFGKSFPSLYFFHGIMYIDSLSLHVGDFMESQTGVKVVIKDRPSGNKYSFVTVEPEANSDKLLQATRYVVLSNVHMAEKGKARKKEQTSEGSV